jgi:hypothetical protein
MTPRETITNLLRAEFGPHADRIAIADFFRNVEAAGLVILPASEVKPALEEARRAVRNAVLNLSQADRQNGDILDEAIFRAIDALKGEKP